MIVGIMMIILLITIIITLHLMSKLLHPKEEEGNLYSADVGWLVDVAVHSHQAKILPPLI